MALGTARLPFVVLGLACYLGIGQSFLLPSTTTRYSHTTQGNDNHSVAGMGGPGRRGRAMIRRGDRPLGYTTTEEDDDVDIVVGGERGGAVNRADKFSPFQRIESVKTAVIGAISGSLLSAPVSAARYLLLPMSGDGDGGGNLASWEFDADASALQGALFAIVYRYCVRQDDDNNMLNMGIVGAFVLVRATSGIRVPGYCTALPLDCGDPLGYLDYELISKLLLGGMEGAALFGGAAMAMEYAYGRRWITKFPN
ncbi:hypothetical protein ACHAXA_008726 [Cyclostephanos tholiformis]|uniref:Uncharacterized protein n=1 Tax=Cyclostephanos tholiformis TaxID=382380 RepID=A0ABD3R941_9STRA